MTTDRILLQDVMIVTAIVIIVVRAQDRGELIVHIFSSLIQIIIYIKQTKALLNYVRRVPAITVYLFTYLSSASFV
jgi:hypothetical protein